VSYEPPEVNARWLLLLLVCGHVGGGGGRMSIASPTKSLHPTRDTSPHIGKSSMGRPRIIATSWSVTVVSLHGRWSVWVSGRYRSTSVVNVVRSINGRPPVTRWASDRNPAHCMNGVYCSSHIRGLCVWILSGCNTCNTTIVKIISPVCHNILTKSIKYIKAIIGTYPSILHDNTCSMLLVSRGLKQGELRVPARHLYVQQ
jgi:hypothetical protein